MPRLLFLDFDGVLYPLAPINQLHPDRSFCWLNVLVELLEPWPDVEILVHSSWRMHFSNSELQQLLGPLGQRFTGSASKKGKAQAIEDVLRVNLGFYDCHVVLDDEVRLVTHPGLDVILCNPRVGLSSAETQKQSFLIARHLGCKLIPSPSELMFAS